MKKILLSATILLAGTFVMNAQGYNRVTISYNHSNYSFNKDYREGSDIKGVGLNGAGLNYIHGFSLSKTLPMFLEVGANFNYEFGTKSLGKDHDDEYWIENKEQFQNMNFQVPVNFAWKFNLSDDFSISPYVGVNFKLHFTAKTRYKIDSNIPSDELEDWFDKDEIESKWFNLFDKKEMGGKDYTWNRFQMGWHIGVGATYKQIYLGAQFGTDFIPAFSYSNKNYKPKVNTSNLKVSVGYTF